MENFELTSSTSQLCPAVGYQSVGVCVPVSVMPFAQAGKTTTNCVGKPVVCAGEKCCKGKKNGTCSFTISQKIVVEVPVQFGATTAVGDAFVDCIGAYDKDGGCRPCREIEEEME